MSLWCVFIFGLRVKNVNFVDFEIGLCILFKYMKVEGLIKYLCGMEMIFGIFIGIVYVMIFYWVFFIGIIVNFFFVCLFE